MAEQGPHRGGQLPCQQRHAGDGQLAQAPRQLPVETAEAGAVHLEVVVRPQGGEVGFAQVSPRAEFARLERPRRLLRVRQESHG